MAAQQISLQLTTTHLTINYKKTKKTQNRGAKARKQTTIKAKTLRDQTKENHNNSTLNS